MCGQWRTIGELAGNVIERLRIGEARMLSGLDSYAGTRASGPPQTEKLAGMVGDEPEGRGSSPSRAVEVNRAAICEGKMARLESPAESSAKHEGGRQLRGQETGRMPGASDGSRQVKTTVLAVKRETTTTGYAGHVLRLVSSREGPTVLCPVPRKSPSPGSAVGLSLVLVVGGRHC